MASPTRCRRGFTTAELLVVLVLIGILSAIAILALDARQGAFLAAMESDLRNLVPVQEVYHSDNGKYANAASQLDLSLTPNTILTMVGDADSWSARTQHTIRTDYRCAIYMGPANPIFAPAQDEGVIECLPKRKGGQTKKGGAGGEGGKGGKK